MSFGYTEKEVLAQPEVLEYLRLGYLRRVDDAASGYVEDQFGVQPVAALPEEPVQTVEPVEPTLPAPPMIPEEPEEPKTDFPPVEVPTKPEGLPAPKDDLEVPTVIFAAEEPPVIEDEKPKVVEVDKPSDGPPMPMARKPFIKPKKR